MAKIEHIKNKRGEVIYPVSKEGAIYDENGVLLSTKIATFITRLVDNLANYYLKSETYTKAEVDNLIGAIQGFSYIVVSELPIASAFTMGTIYLVPSEDPQTQNVKDEYITIRSGSIGSYTYSWEQIGSTAIDLSGYVTTEALNTELANYTTTANLTTLLAGKQDTISDLSTIRSGAAAGATAYQKPGTGIPSTDMASGVQTSLGKADSAYQKPSGGIPKTDLESGVQDSLELANTAVQADPIGSIVPPVNPSEFSTKEEVDNIYSDKTVPDVYTFDGVDDAISFDAITLAVDGDAFEFDVMANGTGATKGQAFGTNNGNRTIEVAESCLALGYGNGSWVTGMNGGSGLLNLATLNKKLTQRRKIQLLRDSGDIKVYIDGELIHSEALSNTVTLSKIGGPYSTNYWLGVLYSFRYIHGGVTKEIYELPGYSVSGNIAYTTKRVVSGVLEETIEAVDALDERVEGTENGLTDLEGETFAEQEVTTTIDVSDIPGVVKMAGYNAGPNSSTEIAFNALSGYDSYYFYPSSALSAWLTDPGVTYISLSVIGEAQPFSNNKIQGVGAARYRKSDSDLPSANSPLSIPSGSAVIVTVTAGAMVGFATKSNITTFNGNTPLAEEHIEQVLDAIEENGEGEPMYVAKNAGKLDVYLRIPNGKYIRYPFVKRYKAYTENEYPSFYDNWGIGVPALAEFSGTMADVAPLFLSGEAELAVSVPSGKDGETATYVGGQAHGFENIVTGSNGREICILVDNQKVAEDSVLSLTPASKVDIIQHTQICQAYTNTNPFADVTKHWVWENGKMSCTTSVRILRSVLFSFAQFGMMCVYRRWLGDVNNDYLTNSAIKNDNPFKVWDVSDGWSGMLQSPDRDCTRIVEYGQKGLGFSMSVKSESVKSNGGMFVATNGLAYNKIYFDMGRSFTPSVNDVLEGTQTWEILG